MLPFGIRFSLFALFFTTLLLPSCVSYQRYSMTKQRLSQVRPEALSFYAVDAAHPLRKAWYISEPTVRKEQVSGYLTRLSESEALELSLVRDSRDAQESKNNVLLYVHPKLAMTYSDTLTTTIPFRQIERVEVHEPNYGKAFTAAVLSGAGLFFLIGLIGLGN
jgi:hypothetical protein